jgi:hypothetical protein
MSGYLRLHHPNGRDVEFYECEKYGCTHQSIDDAYSWIHAKKIGWEVIPAIVSRENRQKLSGKNMGLCDSEATKVELYCPTCFPAIKDKHLSKTVIG